MRFFLLISGLLLVVNSYAQDLYFPSTAGLEWETMSLGEAGFNSEHEQALYDYLEATNTDAFLLLKDGKIVIERYFGSFTAATPHLWNSAGKSLMATVVGAAAAIDSLDLNAPTSDYLGAGWTGCPATESNIRVIHQLTMTSGLSDQTSDPFCTNPECLVCLADPGDRWAYHNGPYTLLGEVIEAATGQDLNDFVTERIKDPTGMTGRYTYIGDNRIFISNARSMARFGLLVLNQGVWDGTPVLTDSDYFEAMTNTSQGLNPAYGYLWWLNGKSTYKIPSLQADFPGPILPNAPTNTIAAIGKNGQLVNVVKEEGLVMVRMGGDPGQDVLVPSSYNDAIWIRINAMSGTTTTTGQAADDKTLSVSPNPAREEVRIQSTGNLSRVTVFNGKWQRLGSQRVSGNSGRISLRGLTPGLLFLRIELADGTVRWRRVVKE